MIFEVKFYKLTSRYGRFKIVVWFVETEAECLVVRREGAAPHLVVKLADTLMSKQSGDVSLRPQRKTFTLHSSVIIMENTCSPAGRWIQWYFV